MFSAAGNSRVLLYLADIYSIKKILFLHLCNILHDRRDRSTSEGNVLIWLSSILTLSTVPHRKGSLD